MIQRQLEHKIKDMINKFPIVTVTGTRQCGKSTLLKNIFPEYQYVSLEDRDMREFAQMDPRGFLQEYDDHVIIDEAQHVPDLFSYLQTKVDSKDECGQYILSGSHNFLLMQQISQSLAGRCAVLRLAPFSISELKQAGILPDNVWKQMLIGGFPRLYDKKIDPEDYFPSYVATYIERDVRSIKNITDSSAFIRFVQLCASRSGQILNISNLAGDAGISVPTVNSWLSVLEQSYVVYRLHPYYNNFSKRLVKSPKLYFYDTGLLCYLLGIETEDMLRQSAFKGNIFETMVISEYVKTQFSKGREPMCYYWRDTGQNEIDLLTQQKGSIEAYEIKIAETMNKEFMKTLQKFMKLADLRADQIHCVYTGKSMKTSYGSFDNYMEVWPEG